MTRITKTLALSFFLLGVLLVPATLQAHCDGLDGPVVQAARQALEQKNVDLVLIWVRPEDESAIRAAFKQTLAVRKLNAQARELSDRYFFETLVRIHRAGEGAPYTGLKPANRDLGPAIPAADQAVLTGNVQPVLDLLQTTVQQGVKQHFHHMQTTRDYDSDDLQSGRKFIKAYVEFLHYIEPIYEQARMSEGGHERH